MPYYRSHVLMHTHRIYKSEAQSRAQSGEDTMPVEQTEATAPKRRVAAKKKVASKKKASKKVSKKKAAKKKAVAKKPALH